MSAEDFEFPVEDFTIVDASYENFTFRTDWNENFCYHLTRWSKVGTHGSKNYRLDMVRIGNNPNAHILIKAFPNEVLTQYPELSNLDMGECNSSEFVFTDNEKKYSQALEDMFSLPEQFDLETSYSIFKRYNK